jgi:hypothetical protein
MNKHPATWLLAMLVALGAGQAIPLSSLRRSLETCVIMKAIKVRRLQQVPRERAARTCAHRRVQVAQSYDLPTLVRYFWNARLLRAPPVVPVLS